MLKRLMIGTEGVLNILQITGWFPMQVIWFKIYNVKYILNLLESLVKYWNNTYLVQRLEILDFNTQLKNYRRPIQDFLNCFNWSINRVV